MEGSLKIGSIVLGKYRVERVLGEGGMGIVVAARHEQLGTLFAIKMMQPAAIKYRDARERFLREARACARLVGEHVARVHDVGTLENDAPYMLMEHLSGDDLNHLLNKNGALPVDEAALYVLQACEAIAEAHAMGIVHRDLKPANMFLTRRPNGSPCVKVLDFGISKDIESNNVGPALTKTGTIIGTPMYMAPEQMANNKTTDVRSDIWALGVILYELVTGQTPFLAESMTELVTKVLTTDPRPPSQVRPGVSRDIDAIVLRCLEKQPDKRYASVRELMADLQPLTTASLSKMKLELHDPPAPLRESVKDTTGMQVPTGAESMSGKSLLLTTTAVAPASKPKGKSAAETGGAWGGTSQVFLGKSRKPWVIVAAAGGVLLLLVVGVVALRSSSSQDAALVASASASVAGGASSVSAANDDGKKPSVLVAVPGPTAEPVKTTVEPTATATVRPTATATVRPTATATVRPTATQTAPLPTSPPTSTSTSRIPDF